MTTPPTPAGWYPDPDGSGGQRYWDGSAWTEHRSPAARPTPEPSEPPAAPQRSEEPTVVEQQTFVEQPTVVVPTRQQPHGSEQPTVVVPMRPAAPEDHVGAHRAPEPGPQPGPPPGFTAPSSGPPDGPPAPGDNRKLIMWFSAACAALLAVLVLVVIYGVFIQDDEPVQIASPTSSPAPTTEETTATETGAPGWGDLSPATETEAAVGGETVDGPLSFSVTGVETGTTVSSTDAPVEKTAQGEYIVVRMSVINTSDAPVDWVGMFQKLHAGGTTYNIDDEATFYVGGGYTQIPPGAEVLVGLAYDVPPGTVAESIELHVDPLSPGVQVPLT